MKPVVGVVGASARAAVHSLARAGFSAWAVDQFNDRDLARVAPCALCPSGAYPASLPELAKQFPSGPILYTGGLENHPNIVAELATTRELWGSPPDVLARVRDPFVLFPALAASGFAVPRLIPQGEPCPRDGRWLRKPLRSGGGIGIRFAQPGEPASSDQHFQEFIDGQPMSALHCGTTLLGVTEQLIGEVWLHAQPFAYCGNIGPVATPAFPRTTFGLRGVWGIDFVLREATAFSVEVNPRYTAGVEVLEHATRQPTPPAPLPEGKGEKDVSLRATLEEASSEHASASEANSPFPSGRGAGGVGVLCIGKAIYYAPHAITFPQSGPWDADLAGEFDPWRLPTFADIPDAGSAIQTGWPVLTFFTTGSTPAEVHERLQSRAAELDHLFAEHSA